MIKNKSELYLNHNKNLTFEEMWNYRFKSEVTIALSVFFASNIDFVNAMNLHTILYNQANEILKKYNMKCQQLVFTNELLQFQEYASLKEHIMDLRIKADKIYNDQVDDERKIKRIPIIYCYLKNNIPYSGQSFKDLGWLPFIMIYSNNSGIKDNVTLLHEIGHCAGIDHSVRNNNSIIEDIMMTSERGFDQKHPFTPFKRNNISRLQAECILKAYFSYVNL